MNRYLVSGSQLECIKEKMKDQTILRMLKHITKHQHVSFSHKTLSDDIDNLKKHRIELMVRT
jgi:hypothetical protein